jgi:hypothetical protein
MMANLNTAVIYRGILTLEKVGLNYRCKLGKLRQYFYNISQGACTLKLVTAVIK